MVAQMRQKSVDFSNASYYELTVRSKSRNRAPLLSNNYTVPDFQRNYVWKKAQIDRLIETISGHEGKYLGNVVTLPAKGGRDYLVDGQQRLVTLAIICKVLEEAVSSASLKNSIQTLVQRDGMPRINFSNKNTNKHFKKIMLSGTVHIKEPTFPKNILSAVRSIKRNSIIIGLNNDKKILDFVNKIKELQFGIIRCLNSGEVYNLFEGLNSTGVILTSAEKTKNALLGKLYELDLKQEKPQYSKGRKMWEKVEKSFESANPFWFNKFLRHQWYLINGKVTDKNLFDQIRKYKIVTSQKTEDILEYLQLIEADSSIYIKLREGKLEESFFPRNSRSNSSKDIVDFLKLITALDVEQVYPVLLAQYKYASANSEYYKNSNYFNDVKRLWAFSFLAKYGKVVPSEYESTFAKFSSEIAGKTYKDFKKTTDTFFATLFNKVKNNESKFVRNFNSSYNDSEERAAKFIFSDLFEREKEIKYYEIEHILPQGSDKNGDFSNWPTIPEVKYKDLATYISRIGNLTLIEKKLNENARNHDFDSKCLEYEESEFKENLLIKKYSNFNSKDPSKAIINRGRDLSKKIFSTYLKVIK